MLYPKLINFVIQLQYFWKRGNQATYVDGLRGKNVDIKELTCKGQQGGQAHCSEVDKMWSSSIETTLMQTRVLECPLAIHQDLAWQRQL